LADLLDTVVVPAFDKFAEALEWLSKSEYFDTIIEMAGALLSPLLGIVMAFLRTPKRPDPTPKKGRLDY
jgi:hypothetical protein